MAEQGTLGRPAWLRLARELDPFRATWRLFTNVRWAIGIITFLALASLLGVLVPQVPERVKGNPAAEADWLAVQEGRFGFLTDAMNSMGLFDVFHARWFIYALGLLVVSIAVCTVSRWPSIWRAVTRPRKRVNDAYFQTARHRYDYATPSAGGDPSASSGRAPSTSSRQVLEDVLRRRLYAVERYEERGATYLFADRFQFVQFATFVSHLALITLLAAALVSRFDGFSNGVMIAEGATAPVLPVTGSDQMQVELVDAVGRFDDDGRPLEYRSDLAIYRGGERVSDCTATVNSPCSYDGYRFHQAAYFGFGADVQVRDLASGNVVYRETLSLSDTLPSPHVIIRDGDDVLMDERLVLTDILSTDEFTYYGRLAELENGRVLTIGARALAGEEDWRLAVFEPGDDDASRLLLAEGETGAAGGLDVTYAGLGSLPAAFVPDFPLPPGVAEEGSGSAVLEMGNVVYGTDTASEGTAVEAPAGDGEPRLTVIGLRPQAVELAPGESVEIEDYEYTFLGQKEFAGISVKRDRGSVLIWIGAGMLIGGLLVTFWVPRRRLWAKITPNRTHLAGQAGHLVDLRKEMEDLARRAGAEPEEEERDRDA